MKSRILFSLRAFTLLEMSIVIMVLMALVATGFKAGSFLGDWKKGRQAADTLRTVYVAQRTFLADNPTTPVTSITHTLLRPYLSGNPAVFPTARSLTNTNLNVFVGVSPPFLTTSNVVAGSAPPTRYDPSGSITDSLWDVGE
jgi:type II secretory pathway pseudopilin PulG